MDALSDERFTTSTAIVLGPVADKICAASCSSAPAQFCAWAETANSKVRTDKKRMTNREGSGVSMPGMREL